MGYRLPDERRQLNDVASESIISVDNGTISRISIPCIYSYHDCFPWHDRPMHDHLGWPSPDNPDHSCQLPESCYDNVIAFNEIDLNDEGYDSINVSLLDPPEGLSVSGFIDYNVVRLSITALCDSVTKNDADVSFAVYATGTTTDDDGSQIQLRDVVTKGIIRIIANPIE